MEKTSDLKEFNHLFKEYQGRFIRFAYSYVRDSAVAEDFTMEAFVYYWEKRALLQENSNIPAYILTIIKNKCLNYLEHLQVKQIVDSKLMEHAQWELQTRVATLKACEPYELFTTEAQTIIDKTLASLPEQTRKIFIMSRYHNQPHKEIAEQLNTTTKNIEYHITKALKILRENLKDYLTFFYLFF